MIFTMLGMLTLILKALLVSVIFYASFGIFLPVKFILLVCVINIFVMILLNVFFTDVNIVVKHFVLGLVVLEAVDILGILTLFTYVVCSVLITKFMQKVVDKTCSM